LPVVIPPTPDENNLRAVYARMDGVLIAGGGDIDPAFYGMSDDGLIHDVNRDRDITEINAARWAASDDKPLLGICRGCQVVNVALGGTLYRDIAVEYPGANGIDHDLFGKYPRNHPAHPVQVDPNTRLAAILSDPKPVVNSLHHQALHDVPPNLIISAHSPDGLIEAVEMPTARFLVAVQWHPEEMTEQSETMRRLFAAFVSAAQQ
jgi:putative glutamine amidotransferase